MIGERQLLEALTVFGFASVFHGRIANPSYGGAFATLGCRCATWGTLLSPVMIAQPSLSQSAVMLPHGGHLL